MSTCRFILKAMFTTPVLPMRPIDRYGILAVSLGLVAWSIRFCLTRPPAYRGDPYTSIVGSLLLLFLYLAFSFEWRPSLAAVLRALVWVWIVFAGFYIFYLTCVLYP